MSTSGVTQAEPRIGGTESDYEFRWGAEPTADSKGALPTFRRAVPGWRSLTTVWRNPLLRNGYLLTVSSGLTALIGLVYWTVVAWHYDAATVGSNSAAISMMLLVAAIAQLNLSSAMVRFVPAAGRQTRRFVAGAFILASGLAVLVGSMSVLVVRMVSPGTNYLDSLQSMALFVLGTVVYSLILIQEGVFVGLHRADLVPVVHTAFAIGKLGLVILLAAILPFHGIFASWVVALLIVVAAASIYVFGWAIPRHENDNHTDVLPPVRQIGQFVACDYVGSVASIGSVTLVPLMVIAVLGAEQNAYFAIAWVIAYSLHLVSTNMGISLVAETASDPDRLAQCTRNVLAHTAKLLVPLVILLMIVAPLVLRIFGPGYLAGTETLRILALAAVPNLLVATAISSARVQRRLGFLLTTQLIQCALVLVLSWMLLNSAGLVGAAWAWLIAQTVMAVGLLFYRRRWLTMGTQAETVGAARKRLLLATKASVVIAALLGLLTRLGLRRIIDRILSWARNNRTDGSLSPTLAAAVLDCGTTDTVCTELSPVPTVTDVQVSLLWSRSGEPTAVLKVARTALGAAEIHSQQQVLGQLGADIRLNGLRSLMPQVLTLRDTAEGTISAESYLSGTDLSEVIQQYPWKAEVLTAKALQSITPLYCQSGRVAVVDDSLLQGWVEEPIATMSEVCRQLDPRLSTAVDRVATLLVEALRGRTVFVSWTHGDYTPGNIRLDGPDGPVSGIVDWGGARSGQLAQLDGYMLAFGVSRLVESRELGAIVRRRLRAGGLILRERRPIKATFDDLAQGTCDEIDERAIILLTWLHHASDMWRKCSGYREHRIWWAANISPVLRAVVAASPPSLATPTLNRRQRDRDFGQTIEAVPQQYVSCTLTVAVVICAYTEDRWDDLTASVASVRQQSRPVREIVLVIDYCQSLLDRATRAFPDVTVVPNRNLKGLSGARNTGVATSDADIVAFLDDDAVAAPDWISALTAPYADPDVLGVSGRVVANWLAGRPHWFPPEFDWVVGCSYRGMPTETTPVRNLIGANMSLRRQLLIDSGGFDTALGRIGARPLGCNETELCIRIKHSHPEAVHLYEPTAQVRHSVPKLRGTFSYYRSRCFLEGVSKATVSRLATAQHVLSTETNYLRSTIPHGLASYLAAAVRGRWSAVVSALALMVGVVITGLGYAVGHAELSRTSARPKALLTRLGRLAIVAALPMAIVLWLISLPRIRLDLIGEFGLVPLLPVTFWAAIGLLLIGYAELVRRGTSRSWLLTAHLASLVVFLHATPTILYGTLRYSWAWKIVGLVEFFARQDGVDHRIKELAVFQRWPGFFTLNATLVDAGGLHTALNYAPWAPPFFNLLLLCPLYLIFRRFSTDRRLVWTALVVYVMGAWVGQDYFAPQPVANFLYLSVLALCVRYRAPRMSAKSPGDRSSAPMVLALILLTAAIVPTHQLTPLMTVVALAVLAVCRYRVKALLLVMIVLCLGWNLTFAWPWIQENLEGFTSTFGHAGTNAASGFINLSDASRGQIVVAQIDRVHSAAIGLLAVIGLARRFRHRRDWVIMLLAISPVVLVITNDYGGEMVFRVYLFALPFLSFFAAAAFFPRPDAGWSRKARVTLPLVLLAMTPGFIFGYYGKEQANYFSPNEVSASRFLYGVAPRGSLIVASTNNFPWAFKNYEIYDYMRFGLFEPDDRQSILDDPVVRFSEMMATHHHSYLIITRSQIEDVEMTGALPRGSIDRLLVTLRDSPSFSVIYNNPDAVIFTLTLPEPGDPS